NEPRRPQRERARTELRAGQPSRLRTPLAYGSGRQTSPDDRSASEQGLSCALVSRHDLGDPSTARLLRRRFAQDDKQRWSVVTTSDAPRLRLGATNARWSVVTA